MVKLQEQEGRYWVTIPKDEINFLNWEKGQQLYIMAERGRLIIENMGLDE